MTVNELHDLVEQIGAHVKTLAQSQDTINKLLTEGIRQTGEQVQALLIITQRHRERLNGLEGTQD